MKLMVFDVGGTEIKYSVMDDAMQRTDTGSVPTPMDTQEHFFDVLYGLYAPHKDEVEGIAMSLPGFIDAKAGVVRGGGALLYNIGTPVGPRLAEKCGCKVWLENDGKAAALAEYKQGALQGCTNAAVFLIGTGVGGGVIVNGQLVRGIHGTAGEFSFVNVDATSWEDPRKNMACQCSTTALLAAYRAAKGLDETAPLDGRSFFAAVHAGEKEANDTLHSFAHMIAVQIYNLSVLLDVETVAIGGGISRQQILIDSIRDDLNYIMDNHPAGKMIVGALPRPNVVACRFGNEANQLGAVYSYLDAGL